MIAQYLILISFSSSSIHPGLEGAYSKSEARGNSAGKMFRTAIVRYLVEKSGGILK